VKAERAIRLFLFLSLGIGWGVLTGLARAGGEAPWPHQQRAFAAFAAGRDQEAAAEIVETAQASAGCQWVFPAGGGPEGMTLACAQGASVSGERLSPEAGAERVIYQWGQRRWEARTRELTEARALRSNQHPRLFFEALLQHYPQSELADEAGLWLLEDGFCWQGGAYPDCAAFEIEQYEKYLQAYPFSTERPRVLSEMARRYEVLAERFQEPAPWHKPARSELCATMAQSLRQELIQRYPGSPEARESQKALDQIPAERRPAIPLPREVFEALSREGE
jgi:hypothetical protein